ncbi:MAG TPA: VOC family protein [Bacteroidia bacterium]|nr:VOC family protein [Bacteroidia bacterium]
MEHTITHIEIPAPDLKKAAEFYSKVFGWKVDILPDNNYAMYRMTENSGGGFDASAKPAVEGTGPGLVINVDNIPSKLNEIKSAGGKVVMDKTEIPGGFGFFARFLDPNGNYMQLHSQN